MLNNFLTTSLDLSFSHPNPTLYSFLPCTSRTSWTPLQNSWKLIFPLPSGSNRFIIPIVSCKNKGRYSKTCIREPPSRLTLNSGWCGKSWLSYKGTCHVILLAKLHDMYFYKTTTFPHQPLRSISKVAVLHRFYCNIHSAHRLTFHNVAYSCHHFNKHFCKAEFLSVLILS